MLRVKEEENNQGGIRGRGLSRKWADELSEDEEEEEEEEEIFSESELELYEQYKAAGYRDLVSAQALQTRKYIVRKKRCKFTK